MAMAEVGDEVRGIYEDDYIRAWDEVVKDVTTRKPTKDPGDLEKLLRILGSPASPFKEYLSLVNKNTNFALPAPGAAGKLAAAGAAALDAKAAQLTAMLGGQVAPSVVPGEKITKRFEAINAMSAGPPGGAPIDRMLQSLTKAANDLAAAPAGGAGTPAARAQQGDVLKQLAAEASLMPGPVAEMVTELNGSAREAADVDARTGLEQTYRDLVVKQCKEAIERRYPFDASASNEVTLDDFGRIFGPGGVYDKFFSENLQPLVDTGRTPWAWRQGSEAIAVPGVLAQFQAAQRIRELFFKAGSPQPEVRFTLTPASLDADATRFTLDVDGRQLEYRHGPVKSVPMQWPGAATGSASAQFEPSTAPGPAFTGSWAMFRLLARGQVQAQSDVRYLVSFSAGSLKAQVQLEASSVRNPFAHPELFRFRCGG
jgi:type VI secretion system protein ImpL